MKTEIVNNSELNKFFVNIGWEPVAETEKWPAEEAEHLYLENI